MNITLPLYGSLELNDLQGELIDTPEMQRLANIKQLGFVHLAFPGSQHTRFQHAIGVSHLAGVMADKLGFNAKEKLLVQAAGLLHDIGHTPFGHALECFLPDSHDTISCDLITGKAVNTYFGGGNISKILSKYGINPEDVGDLITGNYKGKKCLQQIINSQIDADKLDYLRRDSLFAGFVRGVVDVHRILDTLTIIDDEIVIKEKGILAIEGLFISKHSITKDVYLHHTARIGEAMLRKAVQFALDDVKDFHFMSDSMLLHHLATHPKSKHLIERLQKRELFKRSYKMSTMNGHSNLVPKLLEKGYENLEETLTKRANLNDGDVLVSMPDKGVLQNSNKKTPRIRVQMLDGSMKNLSEVSPLLKTLITEPSSHTYFDVFSAKENKDIVKIITEEYLKDLQRL